MATSVTEPSAQTAAHDTTAPDDRRRRRVAAALYALAGVACVALGVLRGDERTATFRLGSAQDAVTVPDLAVPATPLAVTLGVLALLLAGWHATRGLPQRLRRPATALVVVFVLVAFFAWAGTGSAATVLDVPGILSTTLFVAVPLVLGAMAGVLSERSGVINVAIEGQMLGGAFAAAAAASIAANLGVGVVAAVVVGALVGVLLAVFSIRYEVNQVVLGVVLNLLVLGLTSFLYSSVLQRDSTALNTPGFFRAVPLPLLSDVPVLGPVLFTASPLFYATVVVVAAVHVGLFRTRWGLRTRAVGEHPKAADTLGIDVNRLRFRNVVVAGGVAGLAGAAVSIGSVGPFSPDMTAGRGFIALAAVIFGRWTPLGSVGAALLFAFCSALQTILTIAGTPVAVPSQFLQMLPYLATVVIVAGAVGRVRGPAASGVPYVKQ